MWSIVRQRSNGNVTTNKVSRLLLLQRSSRYNCNNGDVTSMMTKTKTMTMTMTMTNTMIPITRRRTRSSTSICRSEILTRYWNIYDDHQQQGGRRFFRTSHHLLSSSSSSSSPKKSAGGGKSKHSSSLRDKTDKLLVLPVENTKPWTRKQFEEMKQVYNSWTQYSKYTIENIHMPFQILDRIVIECEKVQVQRQRQRQQQQGQGSGTEITNNIDNGYEYIPTITFINRALDRWRIGIHRLKTQDDINNNTRNVKLLQGEGLTAPKLLSILDDYSQRLPTIQLNARSYSLLMAGHILQEPKSSSIFCTKLVHRMQQKSSSSSLLLNTAIMSQWMDSYIQRDNADDNNDKEENDVLQAVKGIFEYMKTNSKNNPLLLPDKKILARVLECYIIHGTNTNDDTLRHETEQILDYFLTIWKTVESDKAEEERQQQEKQYAIEESVFLSTVLSNVHERFLQENNEKKTEDKDSNRRKKNIGLVSRADIVMSLINEKSKKKDDNDDDNDDMSFLVPDSMSFHQIIKWWSSMHSVPGAAERADYWLNEMLATSAKYPSFVKLPGGSLYTSVIAAWKHSGLEIAPIKAEGVWKKMIEHPKSMNPGACALLLSLWGKSKLPEAPYKAEELLQSMLRIAVNDKRWYPSCPAFVNVISSWKKSNVPEAAERAENILRLLIREYKRGHGNTGINTIPFNATLSMWADSINKKSKDDIDDDHYVIVQDHALDILNTMKELCATEPNLTPSIATVWYVVQCLNPKSENAATIASELLNYCNNVERMKSYQSLKEKIYVQVLQLWMKKSAYDNDHTDGNAGKVAEEILFKYLDESTRKLRNINNNKDTIRILEAVMIMFGYTIQCWLNSNYMSLAATATNSEGVNVAKARMLLEQMETKADEFCQHRYGTEQSSRSSDDAARRVLPALLYSHVALAWARSGLPESSEHVKRLATMLLEQSTMLEDEEKDDANKDGKNGDSLVAGIIQAFAESGNPQRAVSFVDWLMDTYPSAIKNLGNSTDVYIDVIETLVASSDELGLKTSKQLLEEMIDGYLSGNESIKPVTKCFGPIMYAYALRGNVTAVEELWGRLQELGGGEGTDGDSNSNSNSNTDDDDFFPDAKVLSALCRCNAGYVAREDSILFRILERAKDGGVVDLDDDVLHNVLDYLAESGDSTAGKRAETILLKMQELHDKGVVGKPTFQTFLKVIQCWSASGSESSAERADQILQLADKLAQAGDPDLLPTAEGYTSVIKAWSRSYEADAPERIQRQLQHMRQRYSSGDESFKAGEGEFTALIQAYANSGRQDAAMMAQTVFSNSPESYRCTSMYNALIAAQGGDASKAESILDEMHRSFLDGDENVRPNTESFNNLLLSWSKSGSPMAAWRAESIFQRMSTLDRKDGLDIKPDGKTFDIVISTLAGDWGADAAGKIDMYLSLMKEYYRSGETAWSPSAVSYTEAIRAWGSNVDDPRSVLRARALLDEMHDLASDGAESARPDVTTYGVYLQALSQSSIEDKAELARDVLAMMKHSNIQIDMDLLYQIQRCSIPAQAIAASWTVHPGNDTNVFPERMQPSSTTDISSLRSFFNL